MLYRAGENGLYGKYYELLTSDRKLFLISNRHWRYFGIDKGVGWFVVYRDYPHGHQAELYASRWLFVAMAAGVVFHIMVESGMFGYVPRS